MTLRDGPVSRWGEDARSLARAARRRVFGLHALLRGGPRVADPRVLEGVGPFDVCIVGSGPAGAALALDLVTRGRRVVVLESGPAGRTGPATGADGVLAARTSGPVDYPLAASRWRGLGGTSVLWTGACPRLHPMDFERNAYTPPEAGWPIDYAGLEPYFDQAERTLGVRGGPLSAHHPPRRAPLPPSRGPDSASLRSLLDEVGVVVENAPQSMERCDVDHVRVARDLLPAFARHPHALLVCGATVTRLHSEPRGWVTGAEVRGAGGGRWLVRAETYVVAAGGLETPRLLLLSGLGNGSGVLGLGFMEHAKIGCLGAVPGRRFRGSGRSHQFYETFKRRGLGSVILGFAEERRDGQVVLRVSADVELFPSPANRVTLAEGLADRFGDPGIDLRLELTASDRRTLAEAQDLIRRLYADLGARDVRPMRGDGGEVAWLYHHMGTCRMGHDPAHNVTDGDLRVHGSSNLYVAGSAVFVTGGAANPTLTIVALSHRLADHLHARLMRGPHDAPARTAAPALPG